MKKLSVITPCFNEEANVREVFERVKAVVTGLGRYRYECIRYRYECIYGLPVAHIYNHSGLREEVDAVLAHDRPTVCAVDIPAEQPTAPRVTSAVRPNGVIVSKPMEDMWPFLDRDEFEANMIVAPLEEA